MRTIEEIQAAMTALIDGAAGRSLTDEEISNYEVLETELIAVRRSDEVRARNAAYNTVRVPAGAPTPGGTGTPTDTIDAAFLAYLRTGQPNADLTDLRPNNAQSEGVGSQGGYLVPAGFRQKLTERMKNYGGLSNVVENISTETGNNISWPTIDDTANSGEVVVEGSAHAAQSDIVVGKKELRAYTYQTGGASGNPIRMSVDLLQDDAFDLVGKLAPMMGTRLMRALASDLAVGSGVGEPQGIVTGLTGIEIAADTAGIVYDDLLTFIHSVDPDYRRNARWSFNDLSLKKIRQIKDSNGDPLWRSMTSTIGDPASDGILLDYPYTIDQAFPDFSAASNTTNWGVFGDLVEGYVLRKVRSIVIVVNPWTRANQREVEYTAWMRADAVQQNTNAYIALTGEA